MSSKADIKSRVDMLDSSTKLNALERSRRLKSLQVTENKLITRNAQTRKQIRNLEADADEGDRQLALVQIEKRKLEKQKSPIVTEHALLRYVERFWNVDLAKAHEEILKLSDTECIRHGSTVITVFTDPEDHFNLAERESA